MPETGHRSSSLSNGHNLRNRHFASEKGAQDIVKTEQKLKTRIRNYQTVKVLPSRNTNMTFLMYHKIDKNKSPRNSPPNNVLMAFRQNNACPSKITKLSQILASNPRYFLFTWGNLPTTPVFKPIPSFVYKTLYWYVGCTFNTYEYLPLHSKVEFQPEAFP